MLLHIGNKTKNIKNFLKITGLLTLIVFASAVKAQDIVGVAVGSKDHTTLVGALQAAGLVETLQGAGPFTVFAPTNAAFDKLPKGTVETLLKPENKASLSGILTYHVGAGSVDATTLTGLIKQGNGTAVLTTVNGQELKASIEGGKVIITDAKGGKATVVAADLKASNGVIHVTDMVSMPK